MSLRPVFWFPLVVLFGLALGVAVGAEAAEAQGTAGLDPTRPLTQLGVESWTERDGLPQNFVPALAQTPDGYLWTGGERGLVRFDGRRITVFTPTTTPGLPSPWVTKLMVDDAGTLWIGTGTGAVARLREGRFETVAESEFMGGSSIRGLVRDDRGRLWVGTESAGLVVLGPDDAVVARLGMEEGLSDAFITALEVDAVPGSEGLWVATPSGVDQVNMATLAVESGEPRVRSLAGIEATALLSDPDGTLWVGGAGVGLLRVAPGQDAAATDSALDQGALGRLGAAFVSALLRDRRGALWIGTNGAGLHRLHQGQVESLTAAQGFPGDLVRSLLEDREGNLWVGQTGAGLVRLQSGIFDAFGEPEGLPMSVALGLIQARDGALWVGTPGEGVQRIDQGRVTTWRSSDGLGADFVLSVSEAPDGAVWAATLGGGITRIPPPEGAPADPPRAPQPGLRTWNTSNGLAGNQATVVQWDRRGHLWMGFRGQGVQRWDPAREAEPGAGTGAGTRWGTDEGLPSGAITTILDDAEDRVWIGTRGGLARIGADRRTVTVFDLAEGLPHGHVTGLHHDPDGGTWVATMGGLVRIRDDRVTAFGEASGMPSLEPMGVVSDRQGMLWISTSQGILRVSRRELDAVADGEQTRVEVRHFDRSYGLRSAEANGGVHPSALLAQDGSVHFPTMAGILRVDPERTEMPRLTPSPVLESLAVGESLQALHPMGTPTVPQGERALEVTFSAPTFVAPEQVRLRYQLEGFDPDWVEAGATRVVRYTNLPPRSYRFRVETSDRDGVWSGEVAEVELTLEPYLYERRSVQVLALLLVLALGAVAYGSRIRGLKAREEALLQVVRERERAAAALRRSEDRLHLALEAGQMGTWEWDLGDGSLVWSEGMTQLLGEAPTSFEEFRGRIRTRVEPGDAREVTRQLLRVARGEKTEFSVDFALRANGTRGRQVELRGRRVGHGEPRVVGVAADVTALLETQRELRAREEELRQVHKMEAVGSLAGGVAHDFNNLLAVIGMNARLALDAMDPKSTAYEEVQETIAAADRAAELTRQLLAFSRKQILQPRPLELNAAVIRVGKMLRRVLRSNIELETDLEPELRPVLADEGGVEQILVNLMVNAQDAMPAGGVIVLRSRNGVPDPSAGTTVLARPHVVLEVRDTGRGMDAATLSRIFEPFFTTKGVGEGTGLGLASVYGIVQQTGGEVRVESTPGAGSVFRIFLPVAEG